MGGPLKERARNAKPSHQIETLPLRRTAAAAMQSANLPRLRAEAVMSVAIAEARQPRIKFQRGAQKIEAQRFIRTCPHNDAIIAAGETRGLLYDFRVLIDGEERALLSVGFAGRGYRLYDPDHRPITRSDDSHYAREVKAQSLFGPFLWDLLDAGRIPTVAQIEARRALALQMQEGEARAAEIEAMIWAQKRAGPALYAAGWKMLNALSTERSDIAWQSLSDEEKGRRYDAAVEQLRAALASAEVQS